MKAGFVMLMCLFICSIILVAYGAKGALESRHYNTQKVATYHNFSEANPSDGWYRVKGCQLDLTLAVEEQQSNVTVRAMVPVFDVRNPGQRTTHVLAVMDDRPTMKTLNDMDEQMRFKSKQELQDWLIAHRSEVQLKRDLVGLVHKGIYMPMMDLDSKFGSLTDMPISDCSVVASGWEPDPAGARMKLVLGSIGMIVPLIAIPWMFRRRD